MELILGMVIIVFVIWIIKKNDTAPQNNNDTAPQNNNDTAPQNNVVISEVHKIKTCFAFLDESILTEGKTIEQRLVPFDKTDNFEKFDKMQPFEILQKDDFIYNYGNLFAKPDTIFYSKSSRKHLVVEIKSNRLPVRPDELPNTYQLFQVLGACYAYSKQNEISFTDIFPVLRFRNALIVFTIPAVSYFKLEFFLRVLVALKSKINKKKATISSTELAKLICFYENKYETQDREEKNNLSSLRGEITHLVAIHGMNAETIENALGYQNDSEFGVNDYTDFLLGNKCSDLIEVDLEKEQEQEQEQERERELMSRNMLSKVHPFEHVAIHEFCDRKNLDIDETKQLIDEGFYSGGVYNGSWYLHRSCFVIKEK